MPQTCADLDSPATAAAAEATDYAPNAREWDPQSVDGLPAPVLTCLWAPDGGSDSLVTVGVYEVDDAAIAAMADDWQWTISEVAGVELRYRGPLETEFSAGEHAWATREGRLVYVLGSQSDAGLPIAQAVVPVVLG
ncbi:hypothetical protein GCM10009846_17860 [Agrococcus versicolor]|uniref:Uncharacterized protein n=2 Tax=Agrococcus versicolor TaxID=501482 RepID=A0ABN3ASS2_9MICO